MTQISIWKIGSQFQVQVYEQCACAQCEPTFYFNEATDNELELRGLIKRATIEFIKITT